MAIKANRDILYCEKATTKPKINLPVKRAAPLKRYQNRGYPYCAFAARKTQKLTELRINQKICFLNKQFAQGTITVEAAFCGTLFFLALFSLLFLFQIIIRQNQIQAQLGKAVQQYEVYGTKTGSIEGIIKNKIFIQWEEEEGICYVKQDFTVPYIGEMFFSVSMYQQLKIHSYDGKSMIPEGEDSEKYVYITDRGSVYHVTESCSYLNPQIQTVSYTEIAGKRNFSGGKYYACESCCREQQLSDNTVLYYTPYGESYHISRSCPGLKRTIRKVKLSSINLPPCSKCAQ